MRIVLAILTGFILSGCVGTRVPKTLTAAVEVRVQVPENPAPIIVPGWGESIIVGEGMVELPELGEGQTPGLQVAVAEPAAHSAAEHDLRDKIDILPLQDGTPLSRLLEDNSDFQQVVDTELTDAVMETVSSVPEGIVTVRLGLSLEEIAEATRSAMIADRNANPPPTREESDATAEALAKRDAAIQLRNAFLGQPVTSSVTVGDQMRWDVELETEVNRAVRSARVLRNQRTINDTWVVELEAETAGVMTFARREK